MKTWFEKSSKFGCGFILSLKLQLCLLVFVPFCMWACGEDAFLHFRKPQCLLHWAQDGRVVAEEGKVKTRRHATWSGLWHVLFVCERIKYLQNKELKKMNGAEQRWERKHYISTLHIPLFYTLNILNATVCYVWKCIVPFKQWTMNIRHFTP